MQAITYQKYGFTEVLTTSQLAQPTPKDDEILVKIFATTVTPVDVAFLKGKPYIARLFTGLFKPKNKVLGTELSGEIVAIGKSVTKYKLGDCVFASPADGNGAHAEYICLPEDGAQALMADDWTYEQAAAICNGALTALPFLRDAGNIKAGDKVLIIGASGSIGTVAVQLAKHFGAKVTAVCSGKNVELVESLGTDEVIDYKQQDFTQNQVKYDIIFDTIGNSNFHKCRNSLTHKGRYLSTTIDFSNLLFMLFGNMWGGKQAVFAATGLRKAAEQIVDLALIKKLVSNGKLKIIIDRAYSFEQIADAYVHVDKGHKVGNVVISINQ
ncbi:MAG: NAD(P)-dependent alcohol dehydrogenase [Rhizobiales bacterium]|nr:NAD(P)-dependent alcohol dehydrogenase [Hyphomicrobiales bacterium]NRB13128.1 NAD(P)-dependent alcohol dehydrogenase [Hyphomicrobiales bacterium]